MYPQLNARHSFIEGVLGELIMMKKSPDGAVLLFKAPMVQHHDIPQLSQEKSALSRE